MAPLVTVGVSDEVAQVTDADLLEDVEKLMPARLATLKDPGSPDRITTLAENEPPTPDKSKTKRSHTQGREFVLCQRDVGCALDDSWSE